MLPDAKNPCRTGAKRSGRGLPQGGLGGTWTPGPVFNPRMSGPHVNHRHPGRKIEKNFARAGIFLRTCLHLPTGGLFPALLPRFDNSFGHIFSPEFSLQNIRPLDVTTGTSPQPTLTGAYPGQYHIQARLRPQTRLPKGTRAGRDECDGMLRADLDPQRAKAPMNPDRYTIGKPWAERLDYYRKNGFSDWIK